MSKVHCIPHETGISFTYDGVQYVYNADGFWHFGEEGGLQSLDESDVPLIVSELAEHSIGITGDRPRATALKNPPPTVGRGPVPRHASIVTANVRGLLSCGRFSFCLRDRGGLSPALHSPRRFSFGSNTRGGLSPALRKKVGFPLGALGP